MFKPKYIISNKLLSNIKRINTLINSLNNRRFSKIVLVNFEREARELSSFASTSIEGNPLPLTEVKKILKAKPEYIRDAEKEVLNYNFALTKLSNKLGNKGSLIFNTKLIFYIHKQITTNLLPDNQIGKFRKEPVQISDPREQQLVFLPPDWQKVPELVSELISFIKINERKIDPLILAGIFHKQFVIIHPFMDGNGRTTRLVTKFLLADLGINTFNLFSFESYYNNNVTKYFQKVGENGDYNELFKNNKIDFTLWLEYFTDGVIDELLRVEKLLPLSIQNPSNELKKHHLVIINYLKTNSYITDGTYREKIKRAKATRALDFNFLINQGLIERKGKGKNTYYVSKI